jgi:putative ABC transport system substrate-binding protein
MISRRRLLGGLGVIAGARVAHAQPAGRVPRVGYLFSFTPTSGEHLWAACREGLRQLGYVEGRSIVLEPRWADGHHERLPALAAELVRARVEVIVSAATPASLAAKAAADTIPVVFVAVAEPVKAGLVVALARPGGNVTGVSLLTPELSGKRVQLLASVLGHLPRLVALRNPGNRSHAVFLEETRASARKFGTQVRAIDARNADEIDAAFRSLAAEAGTPLKVFDDPVLWSHRERIVALAAEQRRPAVYGYREFVDAGGLMSYGPDRVDLYRRTAVYVDRILKGARPADLPIEQPTKFEFVVNAKIARALGLTFPPALLLQADQIID